MLNVTKPFIVTYTENNKSISVKVYPVSEKNESCHNGIITGKLLKSK